ncbi:MAG: hypothetical protein IPK65_12065 [Gammaproteobacteria bacterium]|jgi:hypothetical protein|nr:hypothetical protein [Gammaproteobacteria bacterium]
MKDGERFTLVQDRRGMLWDLLLYVPTVFALFAIGLKLWYSPSQSWAYVLFFMACFFLFAGANRILSGRLMLLPASPCALNFSRDQLTLELKNGERVDLVKNLRFFPDYAGKSFGLSGMDLAGKQRQFVMHRGQFADAADYQRLRDALGVFK